MCLSVCMLSCVQLFATPWTVACQTFLPMEFSRQEYWSRLPFPIPGDLPNQGLKPASLTSPALVGRFFTTSSTCRAHIYLSTHTHMLFYRLCSIMGHCKILDIVPCTIQWVFVVDLSHIRIVCICYPHGLPQWLSAKASALSAGDTGLIPGWERHSGGGHGNPLQYACLENLYGQRSLAGYSP